MAIGGSSQAPSGIGGWLILVAITVCLSPLGFVANLATSVRPLNPEIWRLITTPGSRAYHPLFGPLIVGEIVVNVGLLLWSLLMLYFFFGKKRAFPMAMISFLVVRVLIAIIDLGIVMQIPAAAARVGPKAVGAIIASVVATCIWVPYLVRSRRVAATFVN